MTRTGDITPDFAFYEGIYKGHRLDEQGFDELLSDAVAEVECRIRPDAVLSDENRQRAKMAVCSIVEAASGASRLHSYTSGKTSEAFDAPPFSMSAEAAVKRYLGSSGVLKWGRWL